MNAAISVAGKATKWLAAAGLCPASKSSVGWKHEGLLAEGCLAGRFHASTLLQGSWLLSGAVWVKMLLPPDASVPEIDPVLMWRLLHMDLQLLSKSPVTQSAEARLNPAIQQQAPWSCVVAWVASFA